MSQLSTSKIPPLKRIDDTFVPPAPEPVPAPEPEASPFGDNSPEFTSYLTAGARLDAEEEQAIADYMTGKFLAESVAANLKEIPLEQIEQMEQVLIGRQQVYDATINTVGTAVNNSILSIFTGPATEGWNANTAGKISDIMLALGGASGNDIVPNYASPEVMLKRQLQTQMASPDVIAKKIATKVLDAPEMNALFFGKEGAKTEVRNMIYTVIDTQHRLSDPQASDETKRSATEAMKRIAAAAGNSASPGLFDDVFAAIGRQFEVAHEQSVLRKANLIDPRNNSLRIDGLEKPQLDQLQSAFAMLATVDDFARKFGYAPSSVERIRPALKKATDTVNTALRLLDRERAEEGAKMLEMLGEQEMANSVRRDVVGSISQAKEAQDKVTKAAQRRMSLTNRRARMESAAKEAAARKATEAAAAEAQRQRKIELDAAKANLEFYSGLVKELEPKT